jgi:polygalacturonase
MHMPGFSISQVGNCALLLTTLALSVQAQDSRVITEPVIPDPITTCSLLMAQVASTNGDLGGLANQHYDTERVQDALSACSSGGGGTVELRADNGNDAFQIQPIMIPANVTLLVDPGVTVYASLNPRDYDAAAGSCGIIAASSPGCNPLITVRNAPNAAIMGGGTINGRGGDPLTGTNVTWWDLARQAQQENLSQFNPRLIQVTSSDNFVLYQITLINAPTFHVALHGGDGFTAWGITINTPYSGRNTDGIDPGNITNVTIAESSISDGDDNIALGAESSPFSNATISDNHFGPGHGMSIGSYTQSGVSNVSVSNLNISGLAGDRNDNGIRIKSDRSRGGLVQNVSYSNICMLNVYNALVFDPFYTASATGSLIPTYKDIAVHDLHVLNQGTAPGPLKLEGYDADHPLGLTLDNIIFDSNPLRVTAMNANITLGPGPVNMPVPSGAGVSVVDQISNNNPPYSCTALFPGLGPVLTAGGTGAGSYTSIQEAVNALPAGGGIININPGTYTEVVNVNKPNVRLVGLGATPSDVVITFNNSAGTPNGTGGILGTSGSATLFARGDGFFAQNLTVQNTFDLENDQDTTPNAQAVALYVNADRAIFRNVRLIGRQDTLYANSKGCGSATCTPARQYFYGSYIEGNVDFIFGDAAAVFDHCTIKADQHGSSPRNEATITAQSKLYTNYLSGYVFINSVIQSDPGMTKLYLGRPWKTYSTNIFLDTYMAALINSAGWIEFTPGTTNNLPTSYYAEYRSLGLGAYGWREFYATRLDALAAQQYEPDNFLSGSDGWHPALIY